MLKNSEYKLLYFTTPFCSVCQSARQLIEILSLSLEIEQLDINLNTYKNPYDNLQITAAPSIAVIKNHNVIFYADNINNLTDLYQDITQAMNNNKNIK